MRFGRSSHEARLASRSLPLAIALAVLVSLILPTALAQSQGQFAPPHSDAGVDTNGNGLFEFLELTINISVTVPGYFFVVAFLYDGSNTTSITSGSQYLFLGGPSSVIIDLFGPDIRSVGIDGPYRANLYLYDDLFNVDDYDQHVTAPYLATQFDMSPLSFSPPHSDAGVDIDGDGLFEFLQVNASVNVTDAGSYNIQGGLFDPFGGPISFVGVTASLSPGIQSVALDFSGIQIYSHGVDGPYRVDLTAYDASFRFLDSDTHTTAAYAYTDFEQPTLRFAPPHSDAGVDTDGDGRFNVLRISVRVNATEAGSYTIIGTLYDPFFGFIDTAATTVPLGVGEQTVALDFAGWKVRQHGVDGMYTASLNAFDASGQPLDSDTYTTQAYQALDFDTPPAALAPPHSDAGVDRDGDGLYNAIDVNVSLAVDEAGTYRLSATLYDSTLTISLGFASTTVDLGTGPRNASLEFSTIPMVANAIDGPYVATISLLTSDFDLLDSGTHTTAAYTVSQFDPLPAQFQPPHSDRGIDRDVPADGVYNVLEVDVNVSVTEPGVFELAGNLYDPNGSFLITQAVWFGTLSVGPHTLPLFFPGVDIRSSGFDGPYFVGLTLLAIFEGSVFPFAFDPYVTSAYTVTEFQSVTPATLTGTVTDAVTGLGIPFATVSVYDYRNSKSVSTGTDATGHYTLGVYEGDWVIAVSVSGHEPVVEDLSVSGPTTKDVTLAESRPTDVQTKMTFASWDAADLRQTTTFGTDTPPLRLLIDWTFGNQDQNLDQSEWDAFLVLAGYNPPSPPASTGDILRVDGTNYTLVSGSGAFQFVNVTGPTNSTAPPEAELTGSYSSSAPIQVNSSHTIEVRVDYDTPLATNRDHFAFPGPYVLTNFTASPAVSVSGLGTGLATVDPGIDPDPSDGNASELVSLEATALDTARPSISSPSASPDPVDLGAATAIEATITDNVGVASASVEIQDPSSVVIGNFTMSTSGGGVYAYSYTTADVGTHAFTVWASDAAGNWASQAGTFVVVDREPPAVTGATDTPDPVEAGSNVLFSAAVADNDAVATVFVEIRDTSGALLANLTMTFNSGSGAYEVSHAFPTVGTLSYRIWAIDSSGNAASAPGTVVVRDTTSPSLSSTADAPDPVELGGTVTVSTQANDVVGVATVKVEIRAPGGGIVGNFTMTSTGGSGYAYTFIPSATGAYTYQVTAFDASGNAAVASGGFLVRDTTPPGANAGPDQTVNEGATVTFDGTGSSDPPRGIASYSWTFNDGGPVTLTGASPSHTFSTPGMYTVTLTVTDASGNTATDTVVVTVAATTGTIRGTVTSPAGQPIAGASVRLLSGTTETAVTTTNATGQFTFTKVPQGSYTIQVEAAGFETKSQAATVVAAQTVTPSIQLVAVTQGVLGFGPEVWALIVGVVLAAVVLGLVLIRRRRRRPRLPDMSLPEEEL